MGDRHGDQSRLTTTSGVGVGLDPSTDSTHAVSVDRQEDVELRPEVVVDQPLRGAEFVGDVVDRGVRETADHERVRRGVEDPALDV
jgi:hypothetical protein